jgi:peptidyl-prolyl cis-trans isomerase B (cyclophilin B)
MKKLFITSIFISALIHTHSYAADAETKESKEQKKTMNITIETSLGTITAELYQEKAPLTVSNILAYVDEKFYDNTIFHRVIAGFMIQGGGFTKDMQQKTTKTPVKNEADNGLSNTRGTLAMARTMIVDSATCQFFINLEDRNSTNLDFKSKTDMGWGYCVFGKVTEGMDVVDKIAKVETSFSGRHQNVPVEPVIIKSIRRKE